ncbi:MAG: pseudouridine synthase, partial [Elainellaceae cyanobacterium]
PTVQAELFTLNQFGIYGELDPSKCSSSLDSNALASHVTYRYEGVCPRRGVRLCLPRTVLAEQIAYGLMAQLREAGISERHMYGVLLVNTPNGYRVLKAFSGRAYPGAGLGWVPLIPQENQLVLSEFEVVAALDQIKRSLATLTQLPERATYHYQVNRFAEQLAHLAEVHRQRKANRTRQRQQLEQQSANQMQWSDLDEQSRRDGIEKRRLKQERDRTLAPLKQVINAADGESRVLKSRRQALSRQLQAQMHAVYTLTNFAGEQRTLGEIVPHQSMPTGTGECCAPKLLHYAATHNLTPIAMAEFWWGTSSADGGRVHCQFYGACAERCQPIMGFLLSGMPPVMADGTLPTQLLYEDDWLVAINKPPGLLSIPGRSVLNPSNATSQVQAMLLDPQLQSVHRLDQDTSGILLFARSPQAHRHISQQFRQRAVTKQYEALVTSDINVDQGDIHLPIGRYRDCRPERRVDWASGKPSHTCFRVLQRSSGRTRLELSPTTGRTHQIRVHLADKEGLGAPIWGDRLYGGQSSDRLHLHARELTFWHPGLDKALHLRAETPF